MKNFYRLFKVELIKLKHQHFLLIWLLFTLVTVFWLLYPQGTGDDTRLIIDSPVVYYYSNLSRAVMVLSLILPIMGGVMISKLIDMEHRGETFKLLKSNNQEIERVWDVKFTIVFLLLELTTFITLLAVSLEVFFRRGIAIPFSDLGMNLLGISFVNFIVLLILAATALIFKNQFIVLILTLLIAMVDIMSSLFPEMVVRFLPFSYYTLCILSGVMEVGRTADGLPIWKYFAVAPEYYLIFLVFVLFLGAYFVLRKRLGEKEF